MLAHYGNWDPIGVLLLFLVGVVIFLLFADKKPAVLAVTFGIVCIGVCLFLLYLIFFPH